MSHLGNPRQAINNFQSDGFYYFRAAFDIVYFCVVVVILLGIIQGVIVDSFGSFRDEKETLRLAVKKKCFICGITANRLTTEADGMEKHIKRDHHAFMYVYYLDYIMSKDPTARTGIESYVIERYQSGDYSFLPEDDCLSVRNRKSKLRTEHRAKNRMDRSRNALQEELASVHEEINGLKDMLSDLFHRGRHARSPGHSGIRSRINSFHLGSLASPAAARHVNDSLSDFLASGGGNRDRDISQDDLRSIGEAKEETFSPRQPYDE